MPSRYEIRQPLHLLEDADRYGLTSEQRAELAAAENAQAAGHPAASVTAGALVQRQAALDAHIDAVTLPVRLVARAGTPEERLATYAAGHQQQDLYRTRGLPFLPKAIREALPDGHPLQALARSTEIHYLTALQGAMKRGLEELGAAIARDRGLPSTGDMQGALDRRIRFLRDRFPLLDPARNAWIGEVPAEFPVLIDLEAEKAGRKLADATAAAADAQARVTAAPADGLARLLAERHRLAAQHAKRYLGVVREVQREVHMLVATQAQRLADYAAEDARRARARQLAPATR